VLADIKLLLIYPLPQQGRQTRCVMPAKVKIDSELWRQLYVFARDSISRFGVFCPQWKAGNWAPLMDSARAELGMALAP
jgi:hypothetical protein